MPLFFPFFTKPFYIYALLTTCQLSNLQSATRIPPTPTSVLMVILPFRQRHKSTTTRPSPVVLRQVVRILHHIVGWIVVPNSTITTSYRCSPSTPTTTVHGSHFRKPRPSQPLRIKYINPGLQPPQNPGLYHSKFISILPKALLPPKTNKH
jgi:hypothetical protein